MHNAFCRGGGARVKYPNTPHNGLQTNDTAHCLKPWFLVKIKLF